MRIVSQVRLALQTMFGECADKANQEHQVIKRRRKFDARSLAQTFILGLLQNPRASSADLAGMAASSGLQVSKQAIEKRITQPMADFLQSLFREATKIVVKSDQSLANLLDKFTEVSVIDSTSIELPDSQQEHFTGRGGSYGYGKSAMKLQTELDLKTGGLTCIDIENGSDADVSCARQMVARTKGSLRIADLGYFAISVFSAIAASEAYFLSRIQRTTTVRHGETITNVVQFLRSQQQRVVDLMVEIGTKDRLHCRLIAWKLPPEQVAERRRKLRLNQKKRGRGEPSAEALDACEWTFLVTNLESEKLSINEAIVLYRARWQIELLFKRWKSIGLVSLLDGRDDATTMVFLWGRLCAALIQHWLSVLCGWRPDLNISLARVAAAAKKLAELLALGLSRDGSTELIELVLRRFYKQAEVSAMSEKRRGHSAIELLRNPEKIDFVLS